MEREPEFYVSKPNEVNNIYLMILAPPDGDDDRYEFVNLDYLKSRLSCINRGMVLRASTLGPGAGLGVFCAGRSFKAKQLVTYYHGKLYAFARFNPATQDSHARHLIYNTVVLVGNEDERGQVVADPAVTFDGLGAGAYINHSPAAANVEFFPIDNTDNQVRHLSGVAYPGESQEDYTRRSTLLPQNRIIAIRALRDIADGEELFIDYGPQYDRYGERVKGHWEERNPFKRPKYACLQCGTVRQTMEQESATGRVFCTVACQEAYHDGQ